MNRVGTVLLAAIALLVLSAPALQVHDPAAVHRDHVLAPPMPLRVRDAGGQWRAPFFYPLRLVDRLSRTFVEDTARPTPIATMAGEGALSAPWFPLGTDALGRDVWSRVLAGARQSLGLAALATCGALAVGVLLGALAGYRGGVIDLLAMRGCEVVMALPALYLVLVLRASLPLVLPAFVLLSAMAVVLAAVGVPQVARAVRAVVAVERERDYVQAARAAGSGPAGVLWRHLLPASRRVVVGQAVLLFPAFVLAEATLSFMGLGFNSAAPSWGTLLQDAANIRAMAEYPWVLAPAVAMAITMLAVNLVAEARGGQWQA